jgi:hypothetical protein
LLFCLIFCALSNSRNRILLHYLVGAAGRVERNFSTSCTRHPDRRERIDQIKWNFGKRLPLY